MEKDNEEIIWHTQQENILKKWSEIGSSYRFMHDRAFLYYETQNFRFALPVIVISTIIVIFFYYSIFTTIFLNNIGVIQV